MSEVKVNKEQPLARRETPSNELFARTFPFDRYLGLSPFSWMREMTREMDRMFRGGAPLTEAWAPTVDIQQCNGTLTVTAELPGLKKDEVKVEMTDEALIIEGERKREHKEDHEGYHRWERSYGHFYRAIPLPEGAKTDQVKAELNEGHSESLSPGSRGQEASSPGNNRGRGENQTCNSVMDSNDSLA